MSTPDQSLCCEELHPEAVRGIELFNEGDYFEAHEALENAWKAEPGEIRNLYRAILQVGVAYYHLLRGNYTGARKMFHRYRQWIEPFPGTCRGIDITRFRQDAEAAEAYLIRLGPAGISHFDRSLLRPVVYKVMRVDR